MKFYKANKNLYSLIKNLFNEKLSYKTIQSRFKTKTKTCEETQKQQKKRQIYDCSFYVEREKGI